MLFDDRTEPPSWPPVEGRGCNRPLTSVLEVGAHSDLFWGRDVRAMEECVRKMLAHSVGTVGAHSLWSS